MNPADTDALARRTAELYRLYRRVTAEKICGPNDNVQSPFDLVATYAAATMTAIAARHSMDAAGYPHLSDDVLDAIIEVAAEKYREPQA